jgi:hypothetical protein
VRFTSQLLIIFLLCSPTSWAAGKCPSSLLGARDWSAESPSFLTLVDGQRFPYLLHHRVGNQVIVPGAALLTNSLEAARHENSDKRVVILEGFRIRRPVRLGTLSEPSPTIPLRTALVKKGNNLEVQVSSATDALGAQVHSRARVSNEESLVALQTSHGSLSSSRIADLSFSIPAEQIYSLMRQKGLDYGPTFSVLTQPFFSHSLARGVVQLHSSVPLDSSATPHPTLLDAGFHLLAGFAIARGQVNNEPNVAIPFGMERVVWDSALPPCRSYSVAVRLHEPDLGREGVVAYDLELTHENGQVALQILQGRLIVVDPSRLGEES